MDSREFIESGALETYVMGLATAEEAKLVAEMAVRYPEVKAELSAIEDAMEKFDRLNAVNVPSHLKTEIRSKIANVPGSKFPVPGSGDGQTDVKVISITSRKQNNFYKYAAAVAVILLLGSGWYNYSLYQKSNDQQAMIDKLAGDTFLLSRNLATMDTLTMTLTDQLLATNSELLILKHPNMKSIELKGMEVAPDAKAMAYANTSTGEVYLEINNLPAAPDGMQYQFWGIVEDKPVDAGLIPLEGDLSGIHPMTTVPNAGAYAISLEPKGGSQQPTGKIYVMGNP